jgi:heat shock protein HslJ
MKRLWLLGAACVTACAVGSDSNLAPMAEIGPPSLAGTRWVGVIDPGLEADVAPRLEFIAGRVQGYTGCNMMGGTWRVEGNEVRFGAIVVTRRGCIGPAGDIEKRVLAAMGEQSRGRRQGDRLVIEAPNGARFEFRLSRP